MLWTAAAYASKAHTPSVATRMMVIAVGDDVVSRTRARWRENSKESRWDSGLAGGGVRLMIRGDFEGRFVMQRNVRRAIAVSKGHNANHSRRFVP